MAKILNVNDLDLTDSTKKKIKSENDLFKDKLFMVYVNDVTVYNHIFYYNEALAIQAKINEIIVLLKKLKTNIT